MMVGGFMLVQMLLERINLSTPTFTEQQVQMMPSYSDLLFELACKRYEQDKLSASTWSVEIKLMSALVFNTGIIILGAWACKKQGFDITSVLRGVMGMYPTPNNTSSTPFQVPPFTGSHTPPPTQPTQHMKPPSTAFDDDE
jgi:hypothetical protein